MHDFGLFQFDATELRFTPPTAIAVCPSELPLGPTWPAIRKIEVGRGDEQLEVLILYLNGQEWFQTNGSIISKYQPWLFLQWLMVVDSDVVKNG